ncbi:MAG: hypothetical protein ACXVI1_09940 [Halobacteriota archaeon]
MSRMTMPTCLGCKHLHLFRERTFEPSEPTCAAFPDGIPREIRIGEFDHTEPHPEDAGVQFAPAHERGDSERYKPECYEEWVHY